MKIKTIHNIFFGIFVACIVSIIFVNYSGYWDNPKAKQTIQKKFLDNRTEITGEILNSPAFYEKFYRKRIKFVMRINTIDSVDFSDKGIKIFVDTNLFSNYTPDLGNKIKIYGTLEKLNFPNKYTNYLKYQNIYYKVYDNSLGNYSYLGKGNIVRTLFSEMRKSILNKILLLYSGMSKEILPALIVDERSYTSKGTKTFLNSASLSHITSISGTHIVFVFMCIAVFFKNRKTILFVILSLGIIWLYSGITGFSPSCIRSCIMLSIVIIANFFDRNSFTINNFMITCFFMLIINPRQLFMISFLFSFLGVFSIFYFYNFWKNDVFGFLYKKDIRTVKKEGFLKNIAFYPRNLILEVFFATMSAQTFLSPFVVFYFNTLNFSAIIFNLIIVPFVGLMMVLAFISIFLSYIFFPLANFCAFLNMFLIDKTFGLSYYLYERFSIILKKDIDYFYLTVILCVILIIPRLKYIKIKIESLRIYLVWLILFMTNIVIYSLK